LATKGFDAELVFAVEGGGADGGCPCHPDERGRPSGQGG
jgi:hypothetical protein